MLLWLQPKERTLIRLLKRQVPFMQTELCERSFSSCKAVNDYQTLILEQVQTSAVTLVQKQPT